MRFTLKIRRVLTKGSKYRKADVEGEELKHEDGVRAQGRHHENERDQSPPYIIETEHGVVSLRIFSTCSFGEIGRAHV